MINFSELSEILNKQQKAKVNRWAKGDNSLNIHDKKDLINIDKIIYHEHFDKDNAKHLLDNVPNVESNPRIHNSLLSRSTGVPHKRGTPLERFHAAIKSNNQ